MHEYINLWSPKPGECKTPLIQGYSIAKFAAEFQTRKEDR